MKKLNILKYAAAVCFSAVCLFFSASDTDAAYVSDSASGVSYENEISILSKYSNNSSYGGANYTYINLYNSDYRIANVKSKSKNLLAKKTYEYESVFKDKQNKTSNTTYGTTYISYYAKKKGTYTVTFDVINKKTKKKICTKKIKVYVDKNTTYENAIKSIKYAGKDIWEHYPYAKKTTGKISVKLNSGYSLVSIQVGKHTSQGELVYKNATNNKNISLATAQKYTQTYGSSVYKYNSLFPRTYITITYKNKKTKEIHAVTYSLCTINKK